jgi:hypothetical protein
MNPILIAISLISGAVLAYEVLLIRLFAIVQWHHFAYMVISIALLGYGASGTFLALAQDWLKPRFAAAFSVNAVLFGITALLGFALGERLPFNALEVLWNPRQLLYLPVLYVIFVVPFFCGANCVCLAFATFGRQIGRIYRADLVGAGTGALGIVAALFALTPSDSLRLIMGLGIAAAGSVQFSRHASGQSVGHGGRALLAAGLLVAAVLLPLVLPASWVALRISEFKGLSMALDVPGAEVIGEYSSPLGLLSVVRSERTPFRYVPGLSLNSTSEPPTQLGVFTDGDSLSVITKYDGRRDTLSYLDFTTSALPYHLLKDPSVLILGAGGGADVLQAIYHTRKQIDAVELNPQIVRLVQEDHRDFAGAIYSRPDVRLHVAEARSFVARSAGRWDLIQIPLLDAFGASAAGVQSLSESYVYTVEAYQAYLRHLTPDGILAVTRWLKLPPRDSLKLFATALVALEREGVKDPARHLALIRGWNTTTLLIRNAEIDSATIGWIREFAEQRSFDLAYYPGITVGDANRFNLLPEPYFFEGTSRLAGAERDRFIARYKFDLTPASDDRPYFFDFFKWRSLPEFLELHAKGGAALLELGYLILITTLIQAAALSLGLILLPLWFGQTQAVRRSGQARIAAYFFALGLAFLFVEIAFIQRFIVFLGHPLYAAAVVLSGFLVFAGLGSGAAPRLDALVTMATTKSAKSGLRISGIAVSVAAISFFAMLYLVVLPPLFARMLAWPDLAKIGISLLIIAPLGFFMGMPFPLGLARVSERLPALVPWAWGVNGCASVLSAVLAMILAIHFGFTVVVMVAVVLYWIAAASFRRPLVEPEIR